MDDVEYFCSSRWWCGGRVLSENRDIHERVPSNSKINIKKAVLT
jgi:hypothetical protein